MTRFCREHAGDFVADSGRCVLFKRGDDFPVRFRAGPIGLSDRRGSGDDGCLFRRYLLPLIPAGGHATMEKPARRCTSVRTLIKTQRFLNGGGDGGVSAIDPAKLPLNPAQEFSPVYPHDYLKVNTIFEIAHAAGMRTAVLDKHAAYEIDAGPSGKGLDTFTGRKATPTRRWWMESWSMHPMRRRIRTETLQ